MAKKEEEVKLLGFWGSPFSRRVEMALKFKGVSYEYLEQDIVDKSPLLLQLNPVYKKVPVLVHNGKVLAESHLILEYIDQTWKNNPILPQDPYVAFFWAKVVDEQVGPVGLISVVKAEKGIEVATKRLENSLCFLRRKSPAKIFFLPSVFSSAGMRKLHASVQNLLVLKKIEFLDIVAGSMIRFCIARGWEGIGVDMIPEEIFPELNRWIKNLEGVEAVRECIPNREKQIEHMMKIVEQFKSA